MKIITQGQNPNTRPVQAECSHCHTVIEFLPIEAKFTSDQRDGDFLKIDCPACKKPIHTQAPRGYFGPG